MRRRLSHPMSSAVAGLAIYAALLCAPAARAAQPPSIRLAGPPVRLTADQLGAQAPSLASDRAGNFIAVWFSRRDDGTAAVVARKFGASGQPLGPEVEVARDQYPYGQPRVAVAPDGGSVVVWTHLHSDSPGHGLYFNGVEARRLAPDGQPAGAAVLLTDDFSCCDVLPDIAFLSSGQFVVVWYQEFNGFLLPEPIPQEQPVLGRMFDLSFSPRSDVFTVVGGLARASRPASRPIQPAVSRWPGMRPTGQT